MIHLRFRSMHIFQLSVTVDGFINAFYFIFNICYRKFSLQTTGNTQRICKYHQMADQKAHFSVYTSWKQEQHKETPPSLVRAVQVLACYPRGVAFCSGGEFACMNKTVG